MYVALYDTRTALDTHSTPILTPQLLSPSFPPLSVLAGEADDSVRDEAAVAVPADRAGGSGGVPTRSPMVRGVPDDLPDQGRAHHLPLLCQVRGEGGGGWDVR